MEAFNELTGLSDQMLANGYMDVYSDTYEKIRHDLKSSGQVGALTQYCMRFHQRLHYIGISKLNSSRFESQLLLYLRRITVQLVAARVRRYADITWDYISPGQ